MNYDPFSSMSPSAFRQGGLLGQLPSFQTTTGTPFGFQTTRQYGTSGLSPANAAAAQQAEIQRIQGIQGLQSQGLQMQTQSFNLEQQKRDAEKQRLMDSAREYVARNTTISGRLVGTPPAGIPQYILTQARNEYLSSKMQSGGGFTSWSTPAFPSGGMGGA